MSTDLMAVDVLSDEHMLKILHLSSESPMTLSDLSTTCGITGAACFRRLNDLKSMGLLKELKISKSSQDRIYTSNVKKIEIQFRDGLLFCEVEWRVGRKEKDCLDPLSGQHHPWDLPGGGQGFNNVSDQFGSVPSWNRF
jgi:winged helix-turn-helix DNA-binding protein